MNRTGIERIPLINVDVIRSTGPAKAMFFIRVDTSAISADALDAGQVGSETEMHPVCAESTVRVGFSSQIESVGIGEIGLVPVGRRVVHYAFTKSSRLSMASAP